MKRFMFAVIAIFGLSLVGCSREQAQRVTDGINKDIMEEPTVSVYGDPLDEFIVVESQPIKDAKDARMWRVIFKNKRKELATFKSAFSTRDCEKGTTIELVEIRYRLEDSRGLYRTMLLVK